MVVVVLGYRLRSPEAAKHLEGRVAVGVETLDRTDAEYVIFTGARTDPGVPRAECTVMRDYAVELGVDPDCICLEDRARDTIGNGYFTRLLVEELDEAVDTIHVVTAGYHAERAGYIFERCFGPEYDIVTTPFDGGGSEWTSHEDRSFRRAQAFFDGIESGDLDAIERRLETHHDYYGGVRTVPTSGMR